MTRTLSRTGSHLRFAPLLLAAPLCAASCGGDVTPRVQTLASGLSIADLASGRGATAEVGAWVEIDFDARSHDPSAKPGDAGFPFASTRSGEPFVFRLGHSKVLAAFAEGVRGMKEGGRRRLILPPALAYGATGKGPVAADATLEYEIELKRVFQRTSSGLQWIERRAGSGKKPVAGQVVTIRCRAWVVESGRSILDARRMRQPLEVELGSQHAIPALEEALPMMATGASWRLGVSPELGYGETGGLPLLVAGQDFLLDVELLSIRERP